MFSPFKLFTITRSKLLLVIDILIRVKFFLVIVKDDTQISFVAD